MRIYTMAFLLMGMVAFSFEATYAEMAVVEAVLAGEVQDRDPLGRLEPAVSCEQVQNEGTATPVFDSTSGEKIFFWNKIQVGTAGVLRHTWYRKGDEGWAQSAAVELMLSESPGYRTWSSKQIVPSLHQGEWKVEVSTADPPDQVLCTAKFRVE